MVRLGSFALERRVGEGGMGQVWRARHLGSGTPVAIKWSTDPNAASPAARRAFAREVEAVARLDHPGVVQVYEHGVVGEDEAAGGVPARAGQPWLAMELLAGGALDALPPADWIGVRAALLEILDALAHAHARGVIHRDLKPGNVLAAGPDAPRPGLRLTDFGLAWAPDRSAEAFSGGTPPYMAPEQLTGSWRDFGPPTDLYALGCLAWHLVAGAPPFTGSVPEVVEAHLHLPPPPLRPRIAVPIGFGDWLQALLEKHPRLRPACAADVAWTLRTLGDALPGAAPSGDAPLPIDSSTWSTLPALETTPSPAPEAGSRRAATHAAPRVPRDWRGAGRPADRAVLAGVGLGLYGLRPVPLVGRTTERDALWSALVAVASDAAPRAIALTGPRGIGRSRLATWLIERAHELGAADLLRSAGATGVVDAIARRLTVDGLDGDARRARLGRVLAEEGLGIDAEDAATALEVGTPVALAPLIGALAKRRPLVWVLDDADTAPEAVRLARFVLDTADLDPIAALLVLTAERAPAVPGATVLPIGPLPERDAEALAWQGLGLGAEVAGRVARRAAGNPRYAIRLVGDWVARGVLEPGPDGFAPTPGADLGFPADADDAAIQAMDHLLDACSPDERDGMVLGALLGATVEEGVWWEVCQAAGIAPDLGGIERGVARGLLVWHGGAWSFAGPELRERALDRAHDDPRRVRWHLACADQLRRQPRTGPVAEALASHLVDAGRPEDAIPPLHDALQWRTERDDHTAAAWLLGQLERCMDQMGVPPDGKQRWSIRRSAAVIATNLAHMAEAEDVALALLADMEGADPVERAKVKQVLSVIWLRTGRSAQAQALLEEALAEIGPDAVALQQRMLRSLASLAIHRRDPAAAERYHGLAHAQPHRPGDFRERAASANLLGEIARLRGDWDTAARHYTDAVAIATRGRLDDALSSRLNLALVQLARGQAAEATTELEAAWRDARRRYWRYGMAGALTLLLEAYAATGAWDAWDRTQPQAAHLLASSGIADVDFVDSLQRTAAICEAAGHHARADLARRMAATQRRH